MEPPPIPESFRGLLLLHRGRTGLTQRDAAARAGVSLRSIQDWEAGVTLPTAERLQRLIRVLLDAGGLSPEHEAEEAHQLWTAAERESARMRASFDDAWFGGLLAAHTLPSSASTGAAQKPATEPLGTPRDRAQDWGEAPDTLSFVGRVEELAMLGRWVLDERCRLVALLGMGGIGKTSLAARLAQTAAPDFERVYWRSVRDAPPASEWLAGAIGFASDQQRVPPPSESQRITALLQLLRNRRCLLVLDNSEVLFEPGQREGRYRTGMDGYGRVLHAIGEASHQSCLVLTSREAPPELALLGDAVRALELHGLGTTEVRALLADKQLIGDAQAWQSLVERYGGNGLALKIVSETIRRVFDCDLMAFLGDPVGAQGAVLGGIRRLLDDQAERLSPIEHDILTCLAVEREPIDLAELSAEMSPMVARGAVIEAIETLRRRSLVERGERGASFTLQSLVLEYVTDRLVETVAEEIGSGQPLVLLEQPLIKAQAKEYVRQAQERLIGAPVLARLTAEHTRHGSESQLLALLDAWRGRPNAEQAYGPGNVVNLLRLLRGELRGLDLSNLEIEHAYLADMDAQDASLVDSHVADTALADAFGFPGSVALSGDGTWLAAGTATGQVWLWRMADRTPVWTSQDDTGAAWGVALSADSQLLASGGGSGTVRVWQTSTGRLVATMRGHTGAVWSVALSSDGGVLASGGADQTVRLWETRTGRLLATLVGHTGGVYGVALGGDGHLVASGSADGTVRLWDASTLKQTATMHGHTSAVWRVALSADGHLVSVGEDGTVRLWEASTGRPLAVLYGHTSAVWGVAVSANGHVVASGGEDGTVRLWEASTGRPLATLQGHTSVVRGVALSSDGQLLASGGFEGTIRLWEAGAGRPLATLQGHTGAIWAVALSADGELLTRSGGDGAVRLWDATTGQPRATLLGHAGAVWGVAVSARGQVLASGGGDGTARLWETSTGRQVATLQGHTGVVRGVSLSADGALVATGGADASVRLWEASTGHALATLRGHEGAVWSVALSATGELLASSGEDGTVRLWEVSTGHPLAVLRGHTSAVWGVALSATGHVVASAGFEGTVRLWDTGTASLIATLEGHTGAVWSVALSATGALVASGGEDGTARLWELATGRLRASVQAHAGAVHGVALSADGRVLVSGGFDGTVRVWESGSGACLHTLRSDRRYERLDITGLTGVTNAQRAALRALGAVERGAAPNHR
jgi:WD40 repeat protein/transcriptional regulator with XRE-family HTH domain